MAAAQAATQQTPPQARQRSLSRALLGPAAAVLFGVLLLHNGMNGTPAGLPGPRSVPAAASTGGSTAPPSPKVTSAPLPRSTPKKLSIPSIDVDAPFTALSLGPQGQLNPPPTDNKNLVGWFKGGAAPGQPGAAIVAGHVDTKTGPAVFLLLYSLKPGAFVDITRADGIVARFKVDSVLTFSKSAFPDKQVYGQTPTPQLRIITCGGPYDKKAKDYKDNVVVFAHLDSSHRA